MPLDLMINAKVNVNVNRGAEFLEENYRYLVFSFTFVNGCLCVEN